MNRPLVCVSIEGHTVKECIKSAGLAALAGADMLEIRFDCLYLSKVHHTLFLESSPGPVKYAASLLGLCSPDVRLPLVEISENTKIQVQNSLKENNLI